MLSFLPRLAAPWWPFTAPADQPTSHPTAGSPAQPAVAAAITTFTRFTLPDAEWRRGLAQMATTPAHLAAVPGLRFGRMLGSGLDFSPRPDLRHYGLLAEWESEAAARTFLHTDPVLATFRARGWDWRTTWLEPVASHGAWDGAQPFQPSPTVRPLADDEPVAVLTRATIRWSRLWAFWRAVPAASRAVADAPGLRFSAGLGEKPLIRQATLSVWDSLAQMKQYAYHAPAHREVMRRTRAEGWYTEELFARFRVVAEPG